MSANKGITGKVGRWSARHPWTAISLWIAFVATAVVIGGAVGTKKLTAAESASGESGVAARTLDKAGFKLQPGEQVLVQSKTLRASDPAFRAVVNDVITRLDATPNVVKLRSPYAQNTISRDGHSALVSFEIPGTFDTVASKVEPIQATTAAAQSAHRGLRDRGGRRRQLLQGLRRHAGQGLREGRAAVAAHHAPDPDHRVRRPADRRHPGGARHERSGGGIRADCGREPVAARHRRDAVGDPADRPRRRRGLLDLLHRP